jgi:hypothetical protein
MLSSTDEIVQGPGQHTVAGSYGTLLVDDATGNVLQYQNEPNNVDEGTPPDYRTIVRFDVAEYAEYNGGMDDTDILLIGYWLEDGTYEPPVHEERAERGPGVTLRVKQRLEYLRGELRAERISYGELAELQSLAEHIEPGDMELQEAAGIPEEEARH